MVLAALSGAVVAAAAWLILRAGASDEARLARALGIARERRSGRARIDLLPQLGAAVPDGLFAPLAGYPEAATQPRYRAMKGLALLIALAFVVLAALHPAWLAGIVAAPALARAAQARLARAETARRRRELEREVTSALDVIVLGLEAGLPFDRALRAYAEIAQTALGLEITASVRELEVGYRRREALDRLAARTASPTLATLASRARIAEEFGTPLAQALRSLAVDLRAERRQRLQEAALRAPVTMLLPTAAFILLPIFAIILGPIALRVATGSLF